ncbi:hypothetical protein [Streptococcus vestibularis]|uniref:hypothetical protein n=1 Tax=Streptococcus vestibularis TaxID=1343 RepID=UPI0026EEDA0E|nr:hypothetical protein [Streptococcus vestibularis]
MEKYEYKLEAYNFNVSISLAVNIERTLNKEGSEGWELVNWQLCPEPLNVTSLIQSTQKSLNVLATWKREVSHNNVKE